MRRHEHDQRRPDPASAPPREAEAQPADALLALQRSAGNRAVSGLLARQPSPTAPKTDPNAKKGATMTLGLGEDIVIPVDSMQWEGEKEVAVVFESTNPATPDLSRAQLSGKHYETGFASTRALMSRLTDVLITEFRFSGAGDTTENVVWVKLEAKEVDHQPVK